MGTSISSSIKQVKLTYYYPDHFFVLNEDCIKTINKNLPIDNIYGWQKCREIFHSAMLKANSFSFIYCTENKDKTISCLKFFEKKSGIKDSCRIIGTSTEAICFVADGFWSRCRLRFNLLSCLLRDSKHFVDSIEDLFKGKYLSKTKTAVNKFIEGHNFYIGKGTRGWVDIFQHNRNIKMLIDVTDLERYMKRAKKIKNNVLKIAKLLKQVGCEK